MKATRRQELKTNDLAAYIQQLRDYLREHGTRVIVIGVLLIVAVATVLYITQSRAQMLNNGWNAYYNALRSETDRTKPQSTEDSILQWERVIATYDNSQIRAQAYWALVDLCMRRVADETDSSSRKKLLDKTEANCKVILKEYSSNVTLYASALNTLAAIEQDRFLYDPNHNLEHKTKAREYLQRILEDDVFLGSPFRTEVRVRLDDFDRLWTAVELAEDKPPIVADETGDSSSEVQLESDDIEIPAAADLEDSPEPSLEEESDAGEQPADSDPPAEE